MLETELLDHLESPLQALGAAWSEGTAFDDPPLVVLRMAARPARVSGIPILGRWLGVTAIIRQPIDLSFDASGLRQLLKRLGPVVSERYPRRLGREGGLAIGLTVIVLTPQPISADDDQTLDRALSGPPPGRVLPVGLFRVNLGQEALSMALRSSPREAFREPLVVAEALSAVLARHVAPLPPD